MERLESNACLVRVMGPDPKRMKFKDRAFYDTIANGTTILSASGIICMDISGNVCVVTSATLLAPFREVEQDQEQVTNRLIAGCKLDVCFENVWSLARLEEIVDMEGIHEIAESLVMGRIETKRGIHYGSIAKLRVKVEDQEVLGRIRNLQARSAATLRKGDGLVIVSSPFGLVSPYVFQNSVTTGIVSNMIPFNVKVKEKDSNLPPALVLTDGRCLPGSEGGAVFDDAGRLVGMVAPALQRGKAFSIEFGAVIPVDLFAHPLGLKLMQGTSGLVQKNLLASPEQRRISLSVQKCLPSVVIVSIGSSWGSGVVVSEHGHIITCAHVIKPFTRPSREDDRPIIGPLALVPGMRISVGFRDAGGGTGGGSVQYSTHAQLLFCSRGVVDFALLKVDVKFPTRHVKLPPKGESPQIVEGQRCLANGHAYFDPSYKLSCTVSFGSVSRVITHPRTQEPVIVLSCATVFGGHSGGLLANDNGQLIGMLTSNSKLSNGDEISTINFSIPVNILRPLIEACQEDTAAAELVSISQTLDSTDKQLTSIWQLELGSEPPSLPQEISDKSSSFADFVKQFGSKL